MGQSSLKTTLLWTKSVVSRKLKAKWYRKGITIAVSALGINNTANLTASTAKPRFCSLLFPSNNPQLLNRVKRAGRGLRSGWPKPFLPLILAVHNMLMEITLGQENEKWIQDLIACGQGKSNALSSELQTSQFLLHNENCCGQSLFLWKYKPCCVRIRGWCL